jgi:hypothetical protein
MEQAGKDLGTNQTSWLQSPAGLRRSYVEEPQVLEADPDGQGSAGSASSRHTYAIATLDFDIDRNTYGSTAAVAQINPDEEEARSFRLMTSPLYK